MKKRFAFMAVAIAASAYSQPTFARESDSQVRDRLIKESIASYPGNCPCPYNTDRAGRRCGARSAWNRAGGYAPLCYANDVSQTMVQQNRR